MSNKSMNAHKKYLLICHLFVVICVARLCTAEVQVKHSSVDDLPQGQGLEIIKPTESKNLISIISKVFIAGTIASLT